MSVQRNIRLSSSLKLVVGKGRFIGVNGTNGWLVENETLDETLIQGGLDPQVNNYILTGYVQSGQPKNVANISVSAPSGEFFSKVPYLVSNFRSNVSLQRLRTTKTGNRITEYAFSIVYVNDNPTTTASNIIVNLQYETLAIPVRTITIDKVDFGTNQINKNGENREIKVYGAPTANFAISVNENFLETVEGEDFFDKTSDVSLGEINKEQGLSSDLFTSKIKNTLSNVFKITSSNSGKELLVTKGTIGPSGVFSFKQKFPSTIVKRTIVKGAHSSTATITLDDITGIRVGDRIYSQTIPRTTTIKVSSVGGGAVVLDTAITIADLTPVFFKRSRYYSIDILEDLSSDLGPNIPKTDPAFRLSQYEDPIIKVSHLVPSGMKITHEPLSVATGLGDGADYIVNFAGKPNLTRDVAKTLGVVTSKSFEILYDLNDAAEAFTAAKLSHQIVDNQLSSIWTNTLPEENGGTEVSITAISTGSVPSNTLLVRYTFSIKKWGIKDVNIELNVENFTTVA